MPRHDIVFVDGVCSTPPGVDPEVWQLELPSILGMAFGPGMMEVDSPAGYSAIESEEASPRLIDIIEEAGEGEEVSRPGDAMGEAGIVADAKRRYIQMVRRYAPVPDQITRSRRLTQGSQMSSQQRRSQRRLRGLARMVRRVKWPKWPTWPTSPWTCHMRFRRQILEQWNVTEDYVNMLAIPAISMEEPPVHPMELFAFRMLHRGSMNLCCLPRNATNSCSVLAATHESQEA